MKLKWKIVALGVLLGILSLATISPSLAQPWSENFDGGVLPPGWTILRGAFTCAGNRLEGSGDESFNDVTYGSSVAMGTWSFECNPDATGGFTDRIIIFFMASDINPSSNWPDNGYAFVRDPTEGCWRIIRQSGGAFRPLRRSYEYLEGSVSVVITRNETDFIHIWIEDDLVMYTQDTTLSSSEYFYVECEPGTWIDEIVVSDTVDRRPVENGGNGVNHENGGLRIIPIETIAFAIIGVAVIILILGLVLLLRPKKVGP
ncbi:MAG: hypothetical protein ACFFCF_08140 [Promethearchaeota archaeon]